MEQFANWRAYQDKINLANIQIVRQTSREIYYAALETIPRSKTNANRNKTVPWWDSNVQEAIRSRRKALQIFRRAPTPSNLIEFKKCRAKAKTTVRLAKTKCWESFVMNPKTNDRELWLQVKMVNGQYKSNHIKVYKHNNEILTDPTNIANALAKNFKNNSSSSSYSLEFQRIKFSADPQIYGVPEIFSDINYDHNMLELHLSLATCRGKSTGPDEMSYNMIKNHAEADKTILLKMFNVVWQSRSFPSAWTKSWVIPIPKEANDIRPIALTNSLSKVLEKNLSNRLRWFVENNNLLSPYQSGGRQGKTAVDNILLSQNDALNSMNRRHHTICVFFDVRKAYERV